MKKKYLLVGPFNLGIMQFSIDRNVQNPQWNALF